MSLLLVLIIITIIIIIIIIIITTITTTTTCTTGTYKEVDGHGENQNVNIYLKHTQMCHTDYKSEPKLDFRPLNRCFKKSPRGFFLQKSLRGKIPAGKNEKLLLLVDIHFYSPLTYDLVIFE